MALELLFEWGASKEVRKIEMKDLELYIKSKLPSSSNSEGPCITGSSVCSATEILVTFNSLSGLAKRPIAHTCDCTLELSTAYANYEGFYGEFQAILSKVNRILIPMDAL